MKYLCSLLIVFTLCLACGSSNTTESEKAQSELVNLEHDFHELSHFDLEADLADLDGIKARGELVALVDNASTSYFIYKGRRMGYEYELLERFANSIGVALKLVIVDDLMEAENLLNEGYADVLAYHLAITLERKEIFEFSAPHLEVKQVLIQRKPQNWRKMKLHEIEAAMLRDPVNLGGKDVHVRKGSAFATRLEHLASEIGEVINIIEHEGQVSTENLIDRVLSGEIEYTVADSDVAKINYSYHPDLYIKTEISLNQRIAWALNKQTPELKKAIDTWLTQLKRTSDYQTIYDRYFTYTKSQKRRAMSEFSSTSKNATLSKYDDLIKSESRRIGWDWRLLAAQIQQESRFDPKTVSWAGAEGLMQLMRQTQKQHNVKNPFDPRDNIQGGVSHLVYLDDYWEKDISDENERLKFVLGSYNTGQGHVKDAQRLAEKYGANPYKWDDNVAMYLLKKSQAQYYKDPVVQYGYCKGVEPNNYVTEILARFEEYKTFFSADELAVMITN